MFSINGNSPCVAAQVMISRCPESWKPAERGHEIPLPAFHVLAAAAAQVFEIKPGGFLLPAQPARALRLALRQGQRPIQVAQVPLAQQRVAQHGAQRRREGKRQDEGHTIGHQTLENRQQRQVRLGDRLEEPILLEELRVFRMVHVRQMSVQHERQIAVAGHVFL